MNKEDYFKYYIQGSDHYLLPKDIFNELFQETINWREEAQELETNWKKLKNKIYECLEAIKTLEEMLGNAIEDYTLRKLTYNQVLKFMQELEGNNE